MMLGIRFVAGLGTLAAAVAAVTTAEAGGFAIREQSAYGQGSAFAGIAAGGSLSSMFWNPATLSEVEGWLETESVGTGIFPSSEVDVNPFGMFPGSSEGDIAQDAFVPASYFAYRLNERIVFGVGVNAPFGLVTNYPDASILRAFGIAGTSDVFSLNVNPAVSFQVTDWLSLGVGAQIQYLDVRLTNQFLPGLGVSTLDGNDVAFGLTAGVLVTPMPGTEIGLGYRSRLAHELDGDLETPLGTFDVTADKLDLPDIVTLGIRQRITDRFRVMVGAEWSNWSNLGVVEVEADAAPIAFGLPFEYNDGWFFSAGGEFDVTPRLTARAGVGYELSPLDDENRNFRLPDNDRLWLAAGGSFKASERFSVDLGYTYIQAADTDLVAAPAGGPIANGPFSGEADSHVHILAAGLTFKLGGPAADAPIYK
jgi:long-chain fatty acid transport protein